MSDDDDDSFVRFGNALEPFEEGTVPSKKPVNIEDQIVTDERGRRRFHGAFTGGFSAGYFNTVGSKEGWTPQSFTSSKSGRSTFKSQNATDFMDEEDMGVFGIAPQILRPTEDFANDSTASKKRKRVHEDGPLPGVPVLEKIFEPLRETIGIRILQRMGWRPGQGVGPRVSKSHRKVARRKFTKRPPEAQTMQQEVSDTTTGRQYGCFLPPEFRQTHESDSDSSVDDVSYGAVFAPEDCSSPLCQAKENQFGLGYKGLDRDALSSSGHVDLFGSQLKFRVEDKKFSIGGQAFGVGAFEEADEDIYSREDMSQYDFALETTAERIKRKTEEKKKPNKKTEAGSVEGFVRATGRFKRKHFPPPNLPPDFDPLHRVKSSRFEPSVSTSTDRTHIKMGLGRHDLTAAERSALLGENRLAKVSRVSSSSATVLEMESKMDNTTSQSTKESKLKEIEDRVERINKFTKVLQAHQSKSDDNSTAFKPFMKNPDKQDRYEKYLTLVRAGFKDCLKDLQPLEMTEWERERERSEFERAATLYRPTSGIMSSRFVSSKSHDISYLLPERQIQEELDPSQDAKVAAKMGLYGKLTHQVLEWHPDRLLCRRFNIPHPYPDSKFVGIRERSKSLNTLKTSTPTEKAVKPSLFQDLDFSKPPPGLLPASTSVESSSTLEFEPKSNFAEDGTNKDASNSKLPDQATEEIKSTKPPLDLFKEIFADTSSDSDDSDSESKSTALIQTIIKPKPAVDLTLDKVSDRNDKHKESAKAPPSSASINIPPKSIFDNLDLDRPEFQTQSNQKKIATTKMPAHLFFTSEDPKNVSHASKDTTDYPESYGPLPSSSFSISSGKNSSVFLKINPSKKQSDSVWVEKQDKKKPKKKSSKKKSKNKKSKHKVKKHKSKNKKKSKNDPAPRTSSSSSDSGTDSDSDSDSVSVQLSTLSKGLISKLKHITRSELL